MTEPLEPPPPILIEGPLPPGRPACVGKHALMSSTNYLDHLEAKKVCATCPVREWCDGELERALEHTPVEGYGPEGTWAGRFLPGRWERTGNQDHGTTGRYRKHLKDGDAPCVECRRANAARSHARRLREKEAS